MFGSKLGTPRALDRAQQGGRPGKDRRPGVGLATHCVGGQVRQQSPCTVSLHCSQPLACGGPLGKYTVSSSYKQGLQPAQLSSSSVLEHPSHLVRCVRSSLLPGTNRVLETQLPASFHSFPGQAPGWVESSPPPAGRWGHCEDTGSSPQVALLSDLRQQCKGKLCAQYQEAKQLWFSA